MTRVRLAAIQFEAFRGFAESRQIDLDADVVLVRGDNGSGKTSLMDGLLWLICGELRHLTERVKGLRKQDDPVVNRYAGPPARVRLTLRDGSGVWEFERKGDSRRSVLSAWHDLEPADMAIDRLSELLGGLSAEQLESAVTTWGVLRQDAVLSALQGGGLLHERLASVVGLERVTLFAESTTAASKALASERARLRSVRASLGKRHDQALQRLAQAEQSVREPTNTPSTAQRIDSIVERMPSQVSFTRSPVSLQDIATIGTEISAIADGASLTAERFMAVSVAERELLSGTADVEVTLDAATRRLEAALEKAPTTAMASAALELLSDVCPVCGQPIDEESVRAKLVALAEQSETLTAETSEARKGLAHAQVALEQRSASEERVRQRRAEANNAWELTLGQISASAYLAVDREWLMPERAQALATALEGFRADLRQLYSEMGRTAGGAVARTTEDLAALDSELRQAESDLADIERRCERAALLDRAAHEAAQRIVEDALHRLEPSFAEVFDRLSPHPTFSELRARQDIYYGRNQVVPEVYDPERRLTANPMLVYSEGQLNVVALSYFLGMALNARDGALPFLALDDPLQAMDVLSVLGFADLCRRIRDERQLLITTHDRRFADLLRRKLAPREPHSRTLLHEFEGWTREGPVVRTEEAETAEVQPLLRSVG